MNKALLRELTKKMCDTMTNEDLIAHSNIIAEKLFENEVYKNAQNIFIYFSYRAEIRTYGMIKDALKKGKNVFVPKLVGNEMKAVKCNLESLVRNKYGVMEPKETEIIDGNKIDLCITPGIVFDFEKNRIGYGQGYYDDFFKHYPSIYRLALAHDIQVVTHIDTEKHDIKMHEIITEKRII